MEAGSTGWVQLANRSTKLAETGAPVSPLERIRRFQANHFELVAGEIDRRPILNLSSLSLCSFLAATFQASRPALVAAAAALGLAATSSPLTSSTKVTWLADESGQPLKLVTVYLRSHSSRLAVGSESVCLSCQKNRLPLGRRPGSHQVGSTERSVSFVSAGTTL